MTFDTGLIITFIGVSIAVATFFNGRQSSAKSDGSEMAGLKKDIEFISKQMLTIIESVARVDKRIDDNHRDVREIIDNLEKGNSESHRHLHERLDNHIADRNAHGKCG